MIHVFRKLKQRKPFKGIIEDILFKECIYRVHLDAIWSITRGTVRGNTDRINMGVQLSASVGLLGPYKHGISLPYEDHCVYEAKFQTVLHSRSAGNHSSEYI